MLITSEINITKGLSSIPLQFSIQIFLPLSILHWEYFMVALTSYATYPFPYWHPSICVKYWKPNSEGECRLALWVFHYFHRFIAKVLWLLSLSSLLPLSFFWFSFLFAYFSCHFLMWIETQLLIDFAAAGPRKGCENEGENEWKWMKMGKSLRGRRELFTCGSHSLA